MGDDDSYDVCDRHEIDTLPSGYDRCPMCEQERERRAQIRHEMTRDPQVEPY
jgi:hypothetical protein